MAGAKDGVQMMAVLADAFIAEGVDTHFTVMGNGNMWWADCMARKGVRTVHARHEHCALGMASGYARHTGRVGVCSVTSGPGLTQIATELTVAARSRLPLVVYYCVGNMRSSLADQLQVSHCRIVDNFRRHKSCLVQVGGVGQNLLGEGDHVIDVEAPLTPAMLRHAPRPVRRMDAARRAGLCR